MKKSWPRQDRFPLIGILAVVLALSAFWWASQRHEDRVWRHLVSILLEQDESPARHPVIRWTRSPVIGAGNALPAEMQVLKDLVTDINLLIRESGVILRLGQFSEADISIEFLTPEKLPKVYETVFKKPLGAPVHGVGTLAYGDNFDGRVGYILIATDLPMPKQRGLIVEEVAQALGPVSDSPYFSSSIFYESPDGAPAVVTELSDLDRKLVRFLYLHLRPGDDIGAVRRAYDRHWHTMAVPPRPKP